MANKKKEDNRLLYGIGLAGVIGLGYYFFGMMTRAEALKLIIGAGHTSATLADPAKYSDSYIIAWGKALKKGEWVFVVDGKQFDTSTGLASK